MEQNNLILHEVQRLLVSAMNNIHEICESERISYYLIGGSALGAVRHQGFIPWDMDIDIAMPREDYERFSEICKTQLPRELSYVCADNEKYFYRPHAIIKLNNAQVLLNTNYYRKARIENLFIDVFPLDNAPNSKVRRKKQAQKLRRLAYIQSRKECILYKSNTWFEVFAKRFCKLLLSPYSLKFLEKSRNRTMIKYNSLSECECWCSMASHYSYSKQCILKAVYGKPQKIKFEEYDFYVPENINQYLEQIFGKHYMELPSETERCRPDDIIEQLIMKPL